MKVKEGDMRWIQECHKGFYICLRQATHLTLEFQSSQRKEGNVRGNKLSSACKKETHLLLRRSPIIPGTESREKFLLWVLIKRALWHSEQCPQENVAATTSRSFMGLFVTGLQCNAKVKGQLSRGVSVRDSIWLPRCAFLCSLAIIHGWVLMTPLCEPNYISGSLPQIVFS